MKVKRFIKCVKDPELLDYCSSDRMKKLKNLPVLFFTGSGEGLEAASFYVTEVNGKDTLCIDLESVE